MKKLLVIIVAAVLAALVGWRVYQETAQGADDATGPGGPSRESAAMLVDTAFARASVFESDLQVLGELKPEAEVEIMSRISGHLREVLVDRGEEVSKGQLLARVEDEEIQKQLQRAQATLAVSRARVKREDATRANLTIQVRRFRELHEAGLVSSQDLEDLESRLRVAEADLELAKAQIQQAEASLSELRVQAEDTYIYSPLDGVVGRRHLDPGALVNAGLPIVSILELDRVKTVVPVTENVLQQVRIGLEASIVVDAYPDRVYQAQVTRISPYLDPETRSAEIEIETDNPGMLLKPGMFARVTIDVSVRRTSNSIPRSGLLIRGDQQGVYVLNQERRVLFRPVDIGVLEGDIVEITGGLEEGAEIVTTGAQSLNEGDLVRTQ
ncbi:MAG TPA: efflux RND transporter periplasmic adaptor subunit [Acidobacteriota bacterium]|nr:efflux RND transporter periplasmic adaptor subunit [Acidobacteriota bacterium]